MNQILLHHVELLVNEKYFQFAFIPQTINFDDIDAALAAFKVEFDKMKVAEEERIAQRAKESSELEAELLAVKDWTPVDAEIVSE